MVKQPDEIIGGAENPYMLRWFLIPRNRFFNIYLHEFLRSDDDRALHDHPWISLGILIAGEYLEHMPGGVVKHRKRGAIVFRRSTHIHRIELIDKQPVHTIFITGPKIRDWGFHCPQGWRLHKEYIEKNRGCQ